MSVWHLVHIENSEVIQRLEKQPRKPRNTEKGISDSVVSMAVFETVGQSKIGRRHLFAASIHVITLAGSDHRLRVVFDFHPDGAPSVILPGI